MLRRDKPGKCFPLCALDKQHLGFEGFQCDIELPIQYTLIFIVKRFGRDEKGREKDIINLAVGPAHWSETCLLSYVKNADLNGHPTWPANCLIKIEQRQKTKINHRKIPQPPPPQLIWTNSNWRESTSLYV